ncbi:uncharacterized protein A1O9_08224 [Exophiala aquamarina CBS 119918]|uniref:Alpha-L-rhamnosidase C-terminal domain-containing protein n=1 Tax=Exophiala aquamarina CBS 119918 TaxID=1182545 RepID=A0A072P5U7_9EURO|nr:uncharacterized protein A1O9_08224 [Exophiala aquamarina CBS 119918]KEF55474.1 hypothetical protein A1O9_08224 [Exophiala aquamarina CBS 119918]
MDGPGSKDRSQHPQVFAVLSGAIQGGAAAALMRRTILDSRLPKCSYAQSFYLLKAAAQAGVYQELFPYLVVPWRKMMSQNLTTWAEDDVMFRSDCHGWSAVPINEIVSRIFGLSPASAGYGSLKIEPAFSLLPQHSKGSFVTKNGKVSFSWDSSVGLQILSAFDIQVEIMGQRGPEIVHLKKGIPTIVCKTAHWPDRGQKEGDPGRPETSSHQAVEMMTVNG